MPSRLPKNASIIARETTQIASHGSTGIKFDVTMDVGLEVHKFCFSHSSFHLRAAGSYLAGLLLNAGGMQVT